MCDKSWIYEHESAFHLALIKNSMLFKVISCPSFIVKGKLYRTQFDYDILHEL